MGGWVVTLRKPMGKFSAGFHWKIQSKTGEDHLFSTQLILNDTCACDVFSKPTMATGLPSMVLFSSYKGNPNQRKSQESQKTSTRAPIYLWLHSPFLSTIVLKTNPAISLEDWRFSRKKRGGWNPAFPRIPGRNVGGSQPPKLFARSQPRAQRGGAPGRRPPAVGTPGAPGGAYAPNATGRLARKPKAPVLKMGIGAGFFPVGYRETSRNHTSLLKTL